MLETRKRLGSPAIFLHRPLAELQEYLRGVGPCKNYLAIYFDRDGVLSTSKSTGKYVSSPEDLVVLPGAAEALQLAFGITPFVFVVSNQAGVDSGFLTPQTLELIDDALWKEIGFQPTASLYCMHGKDAGCSCRKPGIGMIRLARDLVSVVSGKPPAIELLVGDMDSDEEAATAAEIAFARVGDGKNAAEALVAALNGE